MLRRSLLTASPIIDMIPSLMSLLLLAVIIDTIGILAIRWGLRVAKAQGLFWSVNLNRNALQYLVIGEGEYGEKFRTIGPISSG